MSNRDNPHAMKLKLLSFLSGIALAATAAAAPLPQEAISSDAKWILHLDIDSLRNSQLGGMLLSRVVEEAGKNLKDKLPVDLKAIVEQTASLTAYGPDFKPGPKGRGVLIWQGGSAVEQAVTGLLIQQAEAARAGQGVVHALDEGPNPVYSIGNEMFVAIRPGKAIVLSPQRELLTSASLVLDEKSPNLTTAPTFAGYSELPGGFFFLALAEGFAKDLGLPAQAQVLKLAEGGRIALGEQEEHLKLSVSLKAQTPQNATQIQQVVQGLIALASLTQFDEPGLAEVREWVRNARVKVQEKTVSLDLAVPVEAALRQLRMKAAADSQANIQIDSSVEPVEASAR